MTGFYQHVNSVIPMPEYRSQDDEKWIQQQLSMLPMRARKKAAEKYSAVFEETFNREDVPHKKENRARFEANTRLREYVKRYRSVMNCEVNEPPVFRAA